MFNPALAIAFCIGTLFGFGLLISGMTEPGNVQGFLDLAGAWRPQLLAVLGSAVVVASLMFTWARRRAAPRRWLPAPSHGQRARTLMPDWS